MSLSYQNDEQQDERGNPAGAARDLYRQENDAASEQNPTQDTSASQSAGNTPEKAGGNLAAEANDKEKSGNWRMEYRGPNGEKKKKFNFKAFLKKRGPMGAIAGIFVGGAAGLSLVLSPVGALVHIKEALTNKLDSMSSVVEARSGLALGDKMFGGGVTSATCKIKVKCRFTGITQRQMDRLEIQGAKLVDANGKALTKNPVTRKYTGGATLIMPAADGKAGEKITAKNYRNSLRTSSDVRQLTQSIFSPRYMSWNDNISKKIRETKKLTTNPKSSPDEDEKTSRKMAFDATSGENVSASNNATGKFEIDPDTGAPKLDPDGNPIPLPQDPESVGLDFGGDTDDINKETEKLRAAGEAGDAIPQLPSDPAGVAAMPDYVGASTLKKGLKSALGFLNPLDMVAGMCTSYQFTNILLVTAKTIALTNAMRFSSYIMSTADKSKASPETDPLTSADVSRVMNTMEKPNEYGEAFGESFSYNDIMYNQITDQPLQSSAEGNDTIRLLATIIATVDTALGGKAVIKTSCKIATNPFVEGALSLTSFIPGAGALSAGLKAVAGKGTMAVAKKAIQEKIAGMLAKNLSKDALKGAAKTATKNLVAMAKGPLAMFLAGFLITKYGVPYISQTLAGVGSTDLNGMAAFDTAANGFDGVNSATSLLRGDTPLTKAEYEQFNAFNKASTATYIADRQAESDPMDVTDPYSKANAFAAAFYPLASKLNIFKQGSSGILSAPAAILSSLSPSNLLKSSPAMASSTADETSYCQDEFLKSTGLATSARCHVKYGFNDISMMENIDPNAIVDKMHDDYKQIDDDGNPIAGSDFANFIDKCNTGTENKTIAGVDGDTELDPECYGPKNQTEEWKTFRLYVIDGGVASAMDDEPAKTTNQSTGAAPEECKTMAADDLGQIACKAYQFDNYGYLWGGGHGGTAAGFMSNFKAGQYTAGKDAVVDCSGLVRMSIFEATGVDISGMGTGSYPTYSKFKEISKSEAKAGDILWKPGHTEIIVSNDTSKQQYATFGAHTAKTTFSKQIGPSSYSYGDVSKVFRFQKG
jgi:cell wall-associated NlpC family hydrolase